MLSAPSSGHCTACRQSPEFTDFSTYDSRMPSLTPVELQAARRRSGRLGGRPRKPTREEARAEALEGLVPPAVASLRAHLADGDPGSWRAALRVLELAYGPAPVEPTVDVSLPETAADVQALGWHQLQVLAARFVGELPADVVPVGIENGTATDT
jgi:hypothetical protein